MSNPIKILEVKGKDFMAGLSIQTDEAVGGLFSSGVFNPFTRMGYLPLVPANTAIEITPAINHLTSINSGADGYVFGIKDSLVDKTASLYRIKISDGSVVDYSDKIDQNSSSPITHNGITTYKNRLIYEQGGSIRSNTITPTAVNDTNLLTSASTGGSGTPIIFAEGADGALYFTANTNSSIGKIVLTTGTSGNTATAFTMADTSLVPKDITSDGIYLIFIADNNTSRSLYGNARCKIFFWDMIKSRADVIYDIPDNYVISAKYVDGRVVIIGSTGLWVCNSVTPPKLVFPLVSGKLPLSANQVTVKDNILYWLGSGAAARLFAYGAKVGKPILFNPLNFTSSDNLALALTSSGGYFVAALDAGTNTPKVYLHDTNGTGVSSSATTVPTPLNQTYKFEYAKIVLKSPLSSGQSLTLGIYNANGGLIMDNTSKSYAINGEKQTLIFLPKPLPGSFSQFEELSLVIGEIGAIIRRISVYGTPLPDDNTQVI